MARSRKPAIERAKDLLTLHAGERRGFLGLMLLVLLLTGWAVHEQWFRGPATTDLEPLRKEMEAWVAARNAEEALSTAQAEPFPFDPNAIERVDWLALGFTDRQVDGIERYMAKGGRFRVKKDLARLYSIRPGQYDRLEPFILLPDSLPRKRFPPRERQERQAFAERPWGAPSRAPREERPAFRKVEVNTADSASLVALPGIGPAFARGVLRHRERLGGFVSLDQLAEVPVLRDKPDALARMHELLVVDSLAVRRIPVNTCTVEELAAHPYINWKLAKPLVAFRTQHGPFKVIEDIMGCVLIDDALFRKLAPYLRTE